MSERVEDGKVVLIRYTLTNAVGKVLDQTGDGVFAYLHGKGNVVPGLERALTGAAIGDALDVTLTPDEGYGVRSGPGPQAVPRKEFRRDADLAPGMAFRAKGSDGQEVTLYIAKVQGSKVWVDTHHPLAGETLRFQVEVVGVREPTWEEAAHGHAHGPTGVHSH